MQDKIIDYYDNEHLNELGVSVYLNALIKDDINSLDPNLLDHVEECKLCKSSIIENYKLFKNIDSEDEKTEGSEHTLIKGWPRDNKLKQKKLYGIIKIAAAIILLVGLGYLFNLLSDKNNIVTEELVKNDSTKTINQIEENKNQIKNDDLIINENIIVKEELNNNTQKENTNNIETNNLLAANFEESTNLENFIDINVRSNGELNIISPKLSKTYKRTEHVYFKWETEIDQAFILKILSNKEIVIKKIESIISGEYTLTEPLKPGLYYWKIETEDDLYYTGRFYIK